MNIGPIEFIEDSALIGDKSLSPAQKMTVEASYGLEMPAEHLDLFNKASGGREYIPGIEQTEIDILKGRKAGGTDKILTNCMLYELCARPPKLSVGEKAVGMIVTSEIKRQSRVVFDYCIEKLERSPILRKMIKRATANEIQLINHTSILIFPCNQARVGAPSILFFGRNEVCFWKTEGRSVDKDVLDHARPGLIFPHSKMMKISSVNRMTGEMFLDMKRYYGLNNALVLVLKGSTEFFFPGFSKKKLEAAKRRDRIVYEQEYECAFRQDLKAMFDPDVIDRAIDNDRPLEIPYKSGVQYQVFVDVAGGGGKDHYAICGGHREGEKIIIDFVRSRAPKFNPQEVTKSYADLLSNYKIREVTGDKWRVTGL